MSPNYRQFIFEDYLFDTGNHALRLNYSYDETVHFTENFILILTL